MNDSFVIKKMSPMRKTYFVKFAWRCFVLVLSAVLCAVKPEEFDIIKGMNFFKRLSVLHVLWGVWVIDMLMQLIPMKKVVPLGSQKLFDQRFAETKGGYNETALKEYTAKEHKHAAAIFIVWSALTLAIGALKWLHMIDEKILFVITSFFYVCDLFCVLIWCPFRWYMKNRCCTTCRIFNWDHMMMFSPFLFVTGFYSTSLVIMAIAIIVIWEYKVKTHPERFWAGSNDALKCVNCKDKLCTQYCEKNKAM